MRILYLAKHNKGCNDNEGAIAYALEQLGHQVKCTHESRFSPESDYSMQVASGKQPDLILFQNWRNPRIPEDAVPKVFWYFDRIQYLKDPILASWTRYRMHWMRLVIPKVDLGYCTDGDWVLKDTTKKLRHLMQGADARYARFNPLATDTPLLFCGTIYGRGEGRKSFVSELRRRYGPRFQFYTRLYGHRLFRKLASSAIVLAPDGPVTDRYWSNRVYITTSLGGFMLHPYCELLNEQYKDGEEIVMYRSREHLYELVDYYLSNPKKRLTIAEAGYRRTLAEHTYRHRLECILKELNTHVKDNRPTAVSSN